MKRALQNGIRELEALWELRPLPPERRFVKLGRGRWQAVFERRSKRVRGQKAEPPHPLAQKLIERQVSADVARNLVRDHPAERIESAIELFDWYAGRGDARGAGFLVAGIRRENAFTAPPGFETKAQRQQREAARKSRVAAERKMQRQRDTAASREESARQRAFTAFWATLAESQQADFERAAFHATDRTKYEGYQRAESEGGLLREHYRTLILREHFERTRAKASPKTSTRPQRHTG